MRILRKLLLFAVVIAVAGVQPADAQFRSLRNKLKKKVEDKVERTVEERVEARVDRALDDAVNKSVDAAANELEASIGGLFFSDAPAEIEVEDNEAGDADAPFVSYTRVSRVKLLGGAAGTGAMGALLNRFGATQTTTYTHGAFQREDDENSWEVRDAERKRIIHVDREQKTYWIMELSELVAPMEKLTEQGMPNMEAPGAAAAEEQIRQTKVTIDRRQDVENINGVPCRRTVAVVESPSQMTSVDPETGESTTVESKTFMILDQWHSTEMSGYNTIRAFERKMAEAIVAEFDKDALSDFAGAMKNSAPGIQDAMMEAYAGLGDIEGIAVRETVHFVPASADATLDVDAIIEKDAATPTSEDPNALRPMVTITTEIGGLKTQPFDMNVFDPPSEGYQQMESPFKQAMEMMESGGSPAGN